MHRRKTHEPQVVEHEGRRMRLTQLAKETGLPYAALYFRYHKGDRGDRLVRPLEPRRKAP